MVYSATRGPDATPDRSFLIKQTMFIFVGLGVLAVATIVDYRRIRDFAWVLYGGSVLLLLAVLSPFGSQVNGAQAWFALGPFQLQPAEFTKVALIVTLGALLAEWAGDIDLKRLAVLGVVCGVPMVLILLQPDLGTVAVLVSIVLGMLLIGGLRFRYIVILTLIGIVGVVGAFNSSVLDQYQKDRLTSFLDQNSDTQKTTYNVNQSQTAISNGGVTGEGLFQGRQTELGYVPEQQTDFIFTAVGEELGFVGGAVVHRVVRRDHLACLADCEAEPRPAGHALLRRRLVDAGVPGLRERRHGDGDHACHRHPPSAVVLRRLVDPRDLCVHRPGPERPHAPFPVNLVAHQRLRNELECRPDGRLVVAGPTGKARSNQAIR